MHFTGWYMDVPSLLKGLNTRKWDPACSLRWYQRWLDTHAQMTAWWNLTYPGKTPHLPIAKL